MWIWGGGTSMHSKRICHLEMLSVISGRISNTVAKWWGCSLSFTRNLGLVQCYHGSGQWLWISLGLSFVSIRRLLQLWALCPHITMAKIKSRKAARMGNRTLLLQGEKASCLEVIQHTCPWVSLARTKAFGILKLYSLYLQKYQNNNGFKSFYFSHMNEFWR